MKGNLRLLSLKYLSENNELSGAEIKQKLKQGTGWEPSPGTLYPLLDKLEQQKLVESEKQGRERKFHITEKGETKLSEFQDEQEKYWGEVIQSFKNYSEMFNEEELQDFIKMLEQAKKANYETPYPVIIGYRIIDQLHQYEKLSEQKQQNINQIMEETLNQIEEELQ